MNFTDGVTLISGLVEKKRKTPGLVVYKRKRKNTKRLRTWYMPGGGGVLYISLGGEVGRGPSYPDPV